MPNKHMIEEDGSIRTDFHCAGGCSKTFVVKLDLTQDGYHRIRCPYCDHIHYRGIWQGEVTDDRAPDYGLDYPIIDVSRKSIWETKRPAQFNGTVAHFLRDRWLNRSDVS